MSRELPKVSMFGNLTSDPEVRKAGQTSVVNTTVAITERKQVKGGGMEDGKTHFFDVTVWGHQADHLAASARKGDRVMIVGILVQEQWEAEDGSKRTKVKVQAEMAGLALQFEDIPTRRARDAGFEHSAPVGANEPSF